MRLLGYDFIGFSIEEKSPEPQTSTDPRLQRETVIRDKRIKGVDLYSVRWMVIGVFNCCGRVRLFRMKAAASCSVNLTGTTLMANTWGEG